MPARPTSSLQRRVYGIGAGNNHTRTAMQFRHRKHHQQVTQGNANTHEDDRVEDIVRATAWCLLLLSLPTYRPWPSPMAMRWPHFPARGRELGAYPRIWPPCRPQPQTSSPPTPTLAADSSAHRRECRNRCVSVCDRPVRYVVNCGRRGRSKGREPLSHGLKRRE